MSKDPKFKKVKMLIGLEQQGHIQTVEQMLDEWFPRISDKNKFQVWDDIGSKIGWIGYAVCQDYIRYLKRNLLELEQCQAMTESNFEGYAETKNEEIEQLKKENEEITNLLIKHGDILGGQPRHDINNLLDKFNKGE